jgi:protoporphyrinogen oxidase
VRVAIIGAGAAGLTAAYELAGRGHDVTVYEKSEDALGGLAGRQTIAGVVIDKFYRHIFTSDADIVSLIGDMGLSGSLVWKDARNGIYSGDGVHPFTNPIDLMRFRHLSLPSRARVLPCCAPGASVISALLKTSARANG